MKERLWCLIHDNLLRSDPTVTIVDCMPIPVCQFARPNSATGSMGWPALAKAIPVARPFYGFRLDMRLCRPGVITQICLAPDNVHEGEMA